MHTSRLVNADVLIDAREDSGQDSLWRASHEILPLKPSIIAQLTDDKKVYFRASAILLPAIDQAAKAKGIVVMSPRVEGIVFSGGIQEPDPNGWYRIDFYVRFYTEASTWEEASVWLRTALESVQHPDIRIFSLSESKAFFS